MGRNPFDEFEEMLERLSDQVERGVVQGGGLPMPRPAPADVVETDDAFVVTVELPGYATDEVELTYADRSLRLDASRELEHEAVEDGGRYVRRERHGESVNRSVPIPGDVDEDGIEASFAHGVLTVTLPKTAADEAGHRIDID